MNPDDTALTLVIGTGRCGSTMLSQILNLHPNVLSLSEFWNVLPYKEAVSPWPIIKQPTGSNSIPTHDMTGQEFWQRITAPDSDMDGMFAAGLPTETSASWGRFSPAGGMPAICRVLASLTADVDGLYDRLARTVPGWPLRPATRHCRELFTLLASALGRPRSAVVERSGANATLMPVLLREFPAARFVYLHRDGADSALSMSRHPMFRLGAIRMLANAAADPSHSRLASALPAAVEAARSADLGSLVSPPFDGERLMAYPIPLTVFGWTWSVTTYIATTELRKVPTRQLAILRYERLLTDTRAELSRLAEFIGAPADQDWLDRAEEFTDPGRVGSAAAQLDRGDLAELEKACTVGRRAFEVLDSEHLECLGAHGETAGVAGAGTPRRSG